MKWQSKVAIILWFTVIAMAYINIWANIPQASENWWGGSCEIDRFPHDQLWLTIIVTILWAVVMTTWGIPETVEDDEQK
jgi:quinol-cytochrome oxidoreductase complex cytochrome b subunit